MALHSPVADWEGTLTRAEYYRINPPAKPSRTPENLRARREQLTRSRHIFDQLRRDLAGTRWA